LKFQDFSRTFPGQKHGFPGQNLAKISWKTGSGFLLVQELEYPGLFQDKNMVFQNKIWQKYPGKQAEIDGVSGQPLFKPMVSQTHV